MPSKQVQKFSCQECGMVEGKDRPEFHPHALCLLVKARGDDTDAAREDFAFIIRAARTKEPATRAMVDRFLSQVKRRA
jgi:hypothetical protein